MRCAHLDLLLGQLTQAQLTGAGLAFRSTGHFSHARGPVLLEDRPASQRRKMEGIAELRTCPFIHFYIGSLDREIVRWSRRLGATQRVRGRTRQAACI